MNDEYMPAPSRNAARLVVQTPRIRIIVMSISGTLLCVSTAIQRRETASAGREQRERLRASPSPRRSSARSRSARGRCPTLISAAASQFTRPGDADRRLGDEAPGAERRQRGDDQRHPEQPVPAPGARRSARRATIPTPPPTPRIEDIRPMLPATRSGGNSSRAIENASGKIPPPAPWITRATISSASESDTAASSVPAGRTTSVHSSSRSLPYMSPSRPMIDVADRGRQQEAGQQPGDARLGRVEAVLERRQRRDHRRAEHRVGEPGERQHRQDHVRMDRPRRMRGSGPVIEGDLTGSMENSLFDEPRQLGRAGGPPPRSLPASRRTLPGRPELHQRVVRFDLPRLGDIAGLDGVHLQCHIGTDTVSLARLGARMTGLDFSPASVAQARRLAALSGGRSSSSRRTCMTPEGARRAVRPRVLRDRGVVLAAIDPALGRGGRRPARPGGRLFIREGHPMLWALDERAAMGSWSSSRTSRPRSQWCLKGARDVRRDRRRVRAP